MRALKLLLKSRRKPHPLPPVPVQVTQTVPHWFEMEADRGALFDALWKQYDASHGEPRDPVRVIMFMYLMRLANAAPDGDYLELGTHRGFTARLIWKLMDPSKELLCFDTFEGFAEPDIKVEKALYATHWEVGNFLPTSPEGVTAYVNDGRPAENLKMVKGWFPESFSGYEDRLWRFVHIDMDLYQPIKAAIEKLWPKIVPGGVMLVHDYGCSGFPGARQAVDDFARMVGIVPVPMADRWGSVIMTKPQLPEVRP